jgi:threonylcarbamoyladenosine tRNA methylthiotransferase MtaB
MKKKIAFKTLGCRLNQYETDAIASQFIQAGHEVVDFIRLLMFTSLILVP